jgi:hypothetical protein
MLVWIAEAGSGHLGACPQTPALPNNVQVPVQAI